MKSISKKFWSDHLIDSKHFAEWRYRAVSLDGKGTGVASMGAGLYLTSKEHALIFAEIMHGNEACIEEYSIKYPLNLIDYDSKIFTDWRKDWYEQMGLHSRMYKMSNGEYYLDPDEYPARNAPVGACESYGNHLKIEMECTFFLDGAGCLDPRFGICLINPQDYDLINVTKVDAPKVNVLSSEEVRKELYEKR